MPNGPYYDSGLHVAAITGQGITEAKTGTAQLLLRVKILGVPEGDSYVPHPQQYERSIYMPLTEKTLPFVVENLQMLGFDGTSIAQLNLDHPKAISFVGQQVDVWCKHEMFNGKASEKWQLSNQKEMVIEPLESKKMRQLDALFGRALSGNKTAVSKSASQQASKPAGEYSDQGITDEDIPF